MNKETKEVYASFATCANAIGTFNVPEDIDLNTISTGEMVEVVDGQPIPFVVLYDEAGNMLDKIREDKIEKEIEVDYYGITLPADIDTTN